MSAKPAPRAKRGANCFLNINQFVEWNYRATIPHMENNQANVEVAASHPVHQITPLSKYFAVGLFIVLPFLGGFIGYSYGLKQAVLEPMVLTVPTQTAEPAESEVVVEPVTSEGGGSRSLEEIFDLANKQLETELFFSPEWGVGFTYARHVSHQQPLFVTVEGRVITLVHNQNNGPTLEVFEKDPRMTIEEAIQDRFLAGRDPAKCYLRKLDKLDWYQGSEFYDYEKYSISYDIIQNPEFGQTPWDNADNCPEHYRQTNAAVFFIYNPKAPDRYLFGFFGQDSVASDGRPNSDWSNSIKILPRD